MELKIYNPQADGGIWKYEAVASIKEYLQENINPALGITIIG